MDWILRCLTMRHIFTISQRFWTITCFLEDILFARRRAQWPPKCQEQPRASLTLYVPKTHKFNSGRKYPIHCKNLYSRSHKCSTRARKTKFIFPKNERTRQRPIDEELQAKFEWLSQHWRTYFAQSSSSSSSSQIWWQHEHEHQDSQWHEHQNTQQRHHQWQDHQWQDHQ